jgi:hypothetical protein
MVNPISFPSPQAWSGGADFSALANLGNVYQKGQEQARQLQALGLLGQGPDADAQTLLTSGVPSLAQLGLNLQQKALERQREDVRYSVTDARANAQLLIQQAQEKRAQGNYEKAQEDEDAAAKLIGGLVPSRPAAPDVFTRGAPPLALPPNAPPGVAPPDNAPDITSALPVAPSPPLTDRIESNLTSGQPAAAAGVSREQIAELYRNPITRPLATAFLQKQMAPGDWKFEKLDDGRLVATSATTGATKDVTPPTASGAPPVSKEERETKGYFAAGKQLGMTDEQARDFAANKGKMPSERLSAGEEKRVNTLSDQVTTAQRTLTNIAQLKELSKTAWGFPGAGTASEYGASILPSWAGGKGAVDTQDLVNAAHSNVANVAKTIFPQRVTNTDLKLLQELESSANQPDAVRQRIYKRAEDMFQRFVEDSSREADAIRNKTFYRPGGGAAPAAAPRANAPDPLGIR